jgi:hypothetical protein
MAIKAVQILGHQSANEKTDFAAKKRNQSTGFSPFSPFSPLIGG